MTIWLLLLSLLLPVLLSLGLLLPVMRRGKACYAYTLAATVAESILLLCLVLRPVPGTLTLFSLAEGLSFSFHADGLSRLYAGILAILWPLTALYSFDYMKHEGHLRRFYAFFLLAYGVCAGLAFAANMATLYLFFELLTLSTLPLVMHRMDDEARYAGKRYLIYSMTGAALGFLSLAFLYAAGGPGDFIMGGYLKDGAVELSLLRAVFTIAFFGFGVKAALLPMSFWLPAASVAPTPVTALLHAVAVVKAGAFACIRLTYYCFGTELLVGSAAQYTVVIAAAVTVIFGSARALRSNHLKRRLAWSTVSNLSYILLGAALMSPAGLLGGAEHLLYHAFIKITLFFCVGAVMEKSSCNYVDEIGGLARRMPVTFFCFTVASLALIGLPPLPGFFSKVRLGLAAAETGNAFGYAGLAALMVSAVFTVLYLLPVTVKGYTGSRSSSLRGAGETKRIESPLMNAVLLTLTLCILLLGLFSGRVEALLSALLYS